MQLLNLRNSIQDYLFPVLEEGLGEEQSTSNGKEAASLTELITGPEGTEY